MSMCSLVSQLVGKGYFLWPTCFLEKTLLAFALLHFILQGQTCLLFQVSLDLLLLHSNPLWWKGHLLGGLGLEGVGGLHRIAHLQLLWHQWLRHWLGLLGCWMVCLRNRLRSFHFFFFFFEVAPRNCISVSFVGYEGYFISSMGFLPMVLDVMGI